MHKCLYVVEILHVIFSSGYLAPDPSPRAPGLSESEANILLEKNYGRIDGMLRTQTLASLTRTCRWFQESALQALWYQLDGLAPLIKCMPGDLWEVSDDGKMTLRRPIRVTDWAIFEKYAPRVRTLIICGPLLNRYDPMLLNIFSRTHSAPLLPNLELLRCNVYAMQVSGQGDISRFQWGMEHILRLLISLFSPTLVSVSMNIEVLDSVFGLAAVEYLTGSCPSLKHFHLTGSGVSQERADRLDCDTICNLVQSHPHLQSMRCGVLDEQAILKIAELASLKQFSLCISSPIFEEGLTPPIPNFCHLTWLHIVAPNLGSALSFIRLVQSPLENIVLRVTQKPSPDILQDFSTVVSRRFSSDCLTSIILEVLGDDSTPFKFAINDIRPLLDFQRMKVFELAGPMNLWDDDSILELTVAWPKLERLNLCSTFPWGTATLTLRGLLLLLKHCPGLREIEIAFDATSVPSADEFGGDWPSNTNINEIYLSDSSIADPSFLVAFLLAVLPGLVDIHCYGYDLQDILLECFKTQRKSVGV